MTVMSKTQQLQRYLHQHIPLSAAMQVSVLDINQQTLTLAAPLAPNINHQETVFGGSASTLAILSAWSLLHTRLAEEGIASRLVIQRNEMAYLKPMTQEFTATAVLVDEEDWPTFLTTLRRKGKARISVVASLYSDQKMAGKFSGDFVALFGDK
ncbi:MULTISPECIES: thioesterase domain-containing protein [Methylophaga]|uniref:Putative thioesterase n=1 Tax=Methylophaga muralis TaxID=291169 RepID=A0A1E3GUN1_9GAMM|nr:MULTISPECIES: thioesterase domain-containing protein [Methylophaga]ODN67276.1 putative thioesterase [Methylophaga muralis]